jgi:glycine/D-amino acid oxidase-like deaminating enzyme
MITTDFLVIGGGVIGINIARELKRKFRDQSVMLIEKEAEVAQHASGRNSGVLHAGFYYTADSLKAKFTRQGNIAARVLRGEAAQDEQVRETGRRQGRNGVPRARYAVDPWHRQRRAPGKDHH